MYAESAFEDEVPQRAISELYNSEDFMLEYESILAQQCELGNEMEVVIAAMMLYSDSTRVANFGSASLWPC